MFDPQVNFWGSFDRPDPTVPAPPNGQDVCLRCNTDTAVRWCRAQNQELVTASELHSRHVDVSDSTEHHVTDLLPDEVLDYLSLYYYT